MNHLDDEDDLDLDADPRHLFTAAEAEKVLGIPAGTIRSWFSRKHIWHYGIDKRGRPMFDRDDLLRMAIRSQSRGQQLRSERAAKRARRSNGADRKRIRRL